MGHIHKDLLVAASADTETKHHTRSVLSRRIGGRAYYTLSPGVGLSASHVGCNQSTTRPAHSPGQQDTCSLVDRFCAPSCHGRCRPSPVPCRSPTQPRSLGVAPSTAQSPPVRLSRRCSPRDDPACCPLWACRTLPVGSLQATQPCHTEQASQTSLQQKSEMHTGMCSDR